MSTKSKFIAYAFIAAAALGAEALWGANEEDARATLKDAELTPVNVGGVGWFGCGLDFQSTKFTALNKSGKEVSGYVCRTPGLSGSRIEYTHK